MTGTVTNNLTNITNAEAADSANWDDIGGGQGSGQNLDVYIQGTEARSRKVDNTVLGFSYDAATGQDVSATSTHVGFWVNVLQPGALGTDGVELVLGDAATPKSGNWSGFVALTAATYPAVGGYQRMWLDPARTRDFGAGTLSTSSVRQFGAEFDMGNISGNAHNCILDSIDYTSTGLSVTGGTSGSPATFADIIARDKTDSAGIIDDNFINGPVRIGGAATYFSDSNFSFKAGFQPLSQNNWMRIDIVNDTSGMTIEFGSYFLQGIPVVITGTSSSLGLGTGTFLAAPAMTFNTSVTFAGAIVASEPLTWGGATLNGASLSGSLATGTDAALICDTATDPNGYTDDMAFIGDSNHAIKLGPNTPSEITLSGHQYTGYNASTGSNGTANSGPSDATIYNDSGKAITINVIGGGDSPSVRNGAGATTTVVTGQITLKVTVLDDDTGSPIGTTARVLIMKDSDKSVLLNSACNASGVAQTTISYDADTDIVGWARENSLTGIDYEQKDFSGQYTSSGFSITIRLKPI